MKLSKWIKIKFGYFVLGGAITLSLLLYLAFDSIYEEMKKIQLSLFGNAEQAIEIAIRQKNYTQIDNILISLSKTAGVVDAKICTSNIKLNLEEKFAFCNKSETKIFPILGKLDLYLSITENKYWILLKILKTIAPSILIILVLFLIFLKRFKLFKRELLSPLMEIEVNENIISEISEIQEIAKQIKERSKLKSELATEKERTRISKQVAHDIRSPLAVINELTSKLKLESIDEKLLKFSINRMNEIADDLLVKSKSSKLEVRLFSLNETVAQIIEEKKVITNTLITFEFDASCDYLISGEEKEVARVISNIINNSDDAIKDTNSTEGRINIRVSKLGEMVKLCIEDNGPGVSEKVLENIDQGLSLKKNGNGLGLLHAKRTIVAIGGEFFIGRAYPNGTKVIITLPIEKIKYKENINSKLNILLDDDEMIRFIWDDRAKKNNINLKTFSNFDDLRVELSQFTFDTVFYIDSDLVETKGEIVAQEIYNMGYQNIYMASGYEMSTFDKIACIKANIGKNPPW